MSMESEFTNWLERPQMSFTDNLHFAIKAWQSADLTLTSKYEIVLSWLAKKGGQQIDESVEEFPITALPELLRLRAQPGLITPQTKEDFVEMLLKLASSWKGDSSPPNRTIAEVLQQLCEFELLQDLYRSNYKLHAQVFATLLTQYEAYLRHFKAAPEGGEFKTAYETEFVMSIINSLKSSAKRSGDSEQFVQFYTQYTLQPLTQLLLTLRTHGVGFFEELVVLEQILCEEFQEGKLLSRILEMPLHVRLLALESAIVSRRTVELFLRSLLKKVFQNLLTTEVRHDPGLALTVVAYTLEMLRKHDVSLSFEMTENKSALSYLGEQLFPCVERYKSSHLREVLMVLCAALRLNPLILEQHVFQVTVWMIVAPKAAAVEVEQLFDEYLILLMDMFRRLSRTEKFVVNLLKAIKEWLQNFKLCAASAEEKRKVRESVDTPRKKKKLNDSAEQATETNLNFNFYIGVLLKDFYKPSGCLNSSSSQVSKNNSFPQLKNAWPSSTVGLAFSKLITSLVSKPSLVIWKSLLYNLKDVIEDLQEKTELDENSLFRLDLHAALLSQYFAGCRLAEQFDKFHKEIISQLGLTAEVLGLFGRSLLARAHHKRTMNAFLECSYHLANFNLLLVYYRPDGFEDFTLEKSLLEGLHGFLTEQEWTLIQQRVLNFGKSSCNYLFNRLLLQRTQSQLLLATGSGTHELSLQKTLSTACCDQEQLELVLKAPNAKWLVGKLKREEKLDITKKLLDKPDILNTFVDDLESLELIALQIFENLCNSFAATSKRSLLASLQSHFQLLYDNSNPLSTTNVSLQKVAELINGRLEEYKLKKIPHEDAEQALSVLRYLPIGHLRRQSKIVLFALLLAFYRDLQAAHAEELAQTTFGTIIDLLHFGQHVSVFKYFPTESILKLLPVDTCWSFYEFLFANIQTEEKGTDKFLTTLAEILQQAQLQSELSSTYLRLTLIAIETLAGINGPGAKHMRKHLEAILESYANYVNAHFEEEQESDAKNYKEFVEQTIAGFPAYANSVFTKATKEPDTVAALLPNFRRICKIYIGHSMDYRNPHAIKLMQVALNHRQQLQLDQDEIEFVLNGYWRQLNEDLGSAEQPLLGNTTQSVVKMIIGNKTNEDFLLTLRDIALSVHEVAKDYSNVISLLTLIAKCQFSTIKGAIFNEHFKQIISSITLRLSKDAKQQYVSSEHLTNILGSQQSFVENRMIPISSDTMDSILAFLLDINIKKFSISDTNVGSFHSLHLAMCELCTAIIKHRHILLMYRVPQFSSIFIDLVQAVVLYKNDRQTDVALTGKEVEDLADLALKLKVLMSIIATHNVHVKRVAPFVLTCIINLMVTNRRPTTLYPKIKTHIEEICYSLIGVCDHRVGRFILRGSNEASRQVYMTLAKDHKKYHKFKGKV